MRAKGETVVIEARGFQPLRDGRFYDNTYVWIVRFRNGHICGVRAFFDTLLAARLLAPAEA